ncbi:tRNA (guanine-N(1)-)-methyltransferase TRM10 [Trypanosoma grayi]|uniref:tRNA (guanine-N(1)-)-methyltransferase TRM10 n=1 Tax=Trypanosoma grayi TaxID=71804 RepID=UPI0004F4B27A|nr:tRNA (guanine-N(1)-)-methyltransferase TRM10 [Trypanosoma grayi]KEG14440.1 tRNA (guanine-N(1)-)-methyltransferase TRM10 [Trypanosoma grayi]
MGEDDGGCPVPATQRRQKKVWSEEEKRAYWQKKKAERKWRGKAAAVERREQQQKEWAELSEEERERRRAEAIVVHERRRAAEGRKHAQCLQHLADASLPVLVFDLSFAGCMTAADCRSTVSQVKFSYSALRSHTFPLRPVITSVGGQEEAGASVHGELLQDLRDFEGFRRYPLPIQEEHWSTLYAKERVVFLTADAENVLDRLVPENVYIVGAFVDHNARKFLTRDAAVRHGVRMARLPLEESIEVGNRCKVLTVNHVVEVLCRYAESGDWRTAFDVLPTRRANETRLKRSRVSCGASSASSDNAVKVAGDGGGDGDGGGGGKGDDGSDIHHDTTLQQ